MSRCWHQSGAAIVGPLLAVEECAVLAALYPQSGRHGFGRGTYRVNLRHGVSRIRSGERFTAGIILHAAA